MCSLALSATTRGTSRERVSRVARYAWPNPPWPRRPSTRYCSFASGLVTICCGRSSALPRAAWLAADIATVVAREAAVVMGVGASLLKTRGDPPPVGAGWEPERVIHLDDVRTGRSYNRWATRRLLQAAGVLSDEDLDRDLGGSFGSIRGTLRHIFSGERGWLSDWNRRVRSRAKPGGSPGPPLDRRGVGSPRRVHPRRAHPERPRALDPSPG